MAQELASEMLELAKLMAKFQMIEFILKAFKTRNNFKESDKNGLKDAKHSPLELEKYTLGRFLNDNDKLKLIEKNQIIDRLKILKSYRDYIAHKAFLVLCNIPNKEIFLGFETNPLDYPILNEELDDLILTLTSGYKQL